MTEPPTLSMRIQAVIDCPHITDWYFTTKLSDFVQHWSYETLDAKWHWYRLEYQARGSTHAHSCVKLKNDPGICTLVTKAAAAWMLQQYDSEDTTNSDLIQEGEIAKTTVLQYADWLVTTCNIALPDEFWRLPDPHPCTVSIDKVTDSERDYCDLVNTIQHHTQCSAAYCLRKKGPQQEPKCRFDYPRPLQPKSTLTFEKLSDNTIRATLTTERNDPRMNTHNRLMLQNWRANVDVQVIVDVNACARYMAKYAAKSEPRSQSVQSLFKSCVNSSSSTNSSQTIFRRCMLRTVGERDFSAQETAHMLLSLPLVSCSFNFITISLNGSRKVNWDKDTGELELQRSFLDDYAEREPKFSNTNLQQFAANYNICNGKVVKRAKPVVVRTFPYYSCNPQGEQYAQYCHYQLIKYHPWTSHTSYVWQQESATDEEYISAYRSFLRTDYAQDHIPLHIEDLERSQQYYSRQQEDDEQPPHVNEQEEWMQLYQLNQ